MFASDLGCPNRAWHREVNHVRLCNGPCHGRRRLLRATVHLGCPNRAWHREVNPVRLRNGRSDG